MPGKIDAVGFLIKSMVERDPSKRRVKPSQQALEEFEGLALEDSSDDSDYKVDEKDEDDDGDSNFSGDDDDDNDDGKDNEDSDSSDTSDEADGGTENAELTVSELLSRAAQDTPAGGKPAVKRIKVCSICLGDRSSDQNEIVECDSCHVTVHEGCNGVSESHSVGSSASSDLTEPWFCDACRAGATRFECDLCPNTGGLMKETDTGRWVHLVCALYVPGVAFGDVDRLTAVTLFEIPYTRWGGKACTVCEDSSLARTGVTVQCDAGMCKATFHVTCAQRNGLLQEPRADEEAADPYFAHCKLHTDKTQIRDRKRNYLAMRLYQRQEHPQKMEPARLQRKLGRLQQKYREQIQTRKPKWTPSMKLPRPVSSSPYLLRCLQRRAALMGVDLDQGHHAAAQVTDVSKKWHLPPAFSMEFVSYFLDRGHRTASMSRSLKELMTEKAALQRQENALRQSYGQIETALVGLRQSGDQLRAAGLQLHRQLAALSGDKLKLPAVLQPTRVRKASAGRTPHRLSAAKLASQGAGGRLTLHECVECGASSEQHLLALCDTCNNHYHLACLDPPLTRLPRKSKTAGWECWRCAAAGSRVPSPQTLPDTARGGRRTRQAAAVSAQSPQVKLEAPSRPQRPSQPTPAAAAAAPAQTHHPAEAGTAAAVDGVPKKRSRSVYQRKDIKYPGVGRGNAPRNKRKSAPAGATSATTLVPLLPKTTARLGGRDSVSVDDRRISQIMTQSEAACLSVVVIKKLDDAMVPVHEPPAGPAAKRRRSTTELPTVSAPAAPATAPAVSAVTAASSASISAPATDRPAAAVHAPAPAPDASDAADDSKPVVAALEPAAGSGNAGRPPVPQPERSRRYGSIESTIDDILERVAVDPSGGPPTPPPFVYKGRGRPPTLEPLRTASRRGRPPKIPRTPRPPDMVNTAPAAAAAAAESEMAAPVVTPRPRGRPPGSGRGRGRGMNGVRLPGRPLAGATPGRPRGRPPNKPITVRTTGLRAPGRPRGGGVRRRTKAQVEALNEFLARRRAERRSQSEGAAPEVEQPPVAGPSSGAVEALSAPLPTLVPAKRSGYPRKPGPKERAMMRKAAAAARRAAAVGSDGAAADGAETGAGELAGAVEAAAGPATAAAGPPPLNKPRRRRRTKAEMQTARLLVTETDGAEGDAVAQAGPLDVAAASSAAGESGAAAGEVSETGAAAGEPSPSGSGRPARQRRTKAEMQLYREQVLALKQARERHQLQRQKQLSKRHRQDHGREHVVEVMTDMKIKIRPVPSEAAPSAANELGDGPSAGATAPPPAAAALVCSNCELAGDAATTVRCDNCSRSYHLGCLVPPVSKTPKRHGYGWLCGNCSGRSRPPAAAAAADQSGAPAPTPAPTPTEAPAPAQQQQEQEEEPTQTPADQRPVPPSPPLPPPPPPPPPSAAEPSGGQTGQQQQPGRAASAEPAPPATVPAPAE